MKLLMTLSDMERFWSHRVELARAIVGRGWTLMLGTEDAQRDKNLASMGVQGLPWPKAHGLIGHIKIPVHLYDQICREQPGILHAITIRQAFYMALATRCMGKDIPTVFTIAGLGSLFTATSGKMRLLRPLIVALLKLTFARPGIHIIFQNEDDRACLLKAGIITKDKTTLIRGSGVDLTAFPLTDEPQDSQPIVLFVSRLLNEKGIYEFVEAARVLKKNGAQARFVVAGDFYPKNPHSLDPAVMAQWVKEGVIEWRGQVSDMPSAFKEATIVTLPSYYGEGVPKALLEAAAIGRAIVTTNMPGCKEAVKDKVSGILIPPRDAQALADAIGLLLDDPDKRRAMGLAGRRYVEEDYSVESVVSRTMAVYDRVLNI